MNYKLSIEMNEGSTNLQLAIIDNEFKVTTYSPVVAAMYKTEKDTILYTESKSGELKHAYSVSNKVLVDVSIVNTLEPVSEIIDFERF